MTKVAVYKNADGTTSVVIPAKNVYVPAGKEVLAKEDFITLDNPDAKLLDGYEIPGYVVPAIPETRKLFGLLKDKPAVAAYAVPPTAIQPTVRKATVEEIFARDLEGKTYEIVDRAGLPTDRYFRNAWEMDGSVNMVKAVEIHKDKLREQRTKLLEALDIETVRALGAGDGQKMQEIEQKKQALRDITKHAEISAAQTPEQLKLAALGAFK